MPRGKKRAASDKPAKAGKRIRAGAVVRIKAEDPIEPTNVSSSGLNAAVAPNSVSKKDLVKQKFIDLLNNPENKGGVSNRDAMAHFAAAAERTLLAAVINDMSRDSRLHMSKSSTDGGQLYYNLVAADIAQKHQGLEVSAKMVLLVIEKAGNSGIWTKEIRMQTNIQQQALNKIFKQLEQRRLIKPVKSVTAKAKKLYMLYDLKPSKEITGGVWYSGLEFDHEFISELRTFVMHCVRRMNGGAGVSLNEIKNKMIQLDVSRVQLSLDEVKQLVYTLVYDYHLEEFETGDDGPNVYVAARKVSTMCDFKWWDVLSTDFHFRTIKFEDGVVLGPHELHHHTA